VYFDEEGLEGECAEHPGQSTALPDPSTHSKRSTQPAVYLQHTLKITVQHLDLSYEASAEPKPPQNFPEEAVFNAVKSLFLI